MSTRKDTVWTLPNQLSLSRFFLAVVVFVLIHFQSWGPALAVFLIATLTDWLDGYLARARKETSDLGRSLDPLADKVLTCGAFIFLLPAGMKEGEGWLTPWMVTLVVVRELVITGLRSYLESRKVRFGADWLGKLKMGLQCAALIAILAALQWETITWCAAVRNGLIYAMLAATAISGAQYLWRAAVLLKVEE